MITLTIWRLRNLQQVDKYFSLIETHVCLEIDTVIYRAVVRK